ncbi:hypothetical protein F0562_017097 [Nyssa sinensis]|uniref:HVA22-like protein n=1 Tax=Nyssa sinensis TaxID=561372 RepID=A0A5J4ZDW1_9ASTE|nr:hypothetical protein F0562_017097 [Nyssa sinensis]
MLGDLITRCLLLLLGYAYPAFECFKTMERKKVKIEELRFWCQYWIIVAVLTVLERIGDTFISWVPMYEKHETDIDQNMKELRARIWDLAIYYWQNCTQIGQTAFFQIFQFLVDQSGKIRNITAEKDPTDRRRSATTTKQSKKH